MKKYILMGSMLGIGGWQLYCDARIIYLQEQGYDVYFMNYALVDSRHIKLETYNRVKHIELGDGTSIPYVFSKRETKRIVDSFLNQIGYSKNDQVFVESTCMDQALWGELIAKYSNGIHFSYLLHSHFDNPSLMMKKFFLFKYEQGLLGGMTNDTVPELLSELVDVPKERANGMSAAARNPLVESDKYDSLIYRIRKMCSFEGFIIGYFGTLNKPHFIPLCDEIVRFCKEHLDRKFCFLCIGSSWNGESERKIDSISRITENLFVENIPELFPVPKSLFRCMDICVASWGSSIVASRGGARTLRLCDDVSTKVSGIIGLTISAESTNTNNTDINAENELNQWLENYLILRKYDNCVYDPPLDNRPDFRIIHNKNDLIIRPFEKRNEMLGYFDTRSVNNGVKHQRIRKVAYAILGSKNCKKIKRFFLKS